MKLLFLSLLFSGICHAQSSARLILRSGLYDGHGLPNLSFFTNSTPRINNKGDIAIKLETYRSESTQSIWFNGRIIHQTRDYISEPALNNNGVLLFTVFNTFENKALYRFLRNKKEVLTPPTDPEGKLILSYDALQINDFNQIAVRAKTIEGLQSWLIRDKSWNTFLEQKEKKISYLFAPSLSNSGELVGKVRLGRPGQIGEERPDVILKVDQSRSPTLEAVDKDHSPHSPYEKFENSLALNSNGEMAFKTYNKDEYAIYLKVRNQFLKLASNKMNQIKRILPFTISLNSRREVLFKALGSDDKYGIYLASPFGVKRIVTQGDSVMTDKGSLRFYAGEEKNPFTGTPTMNDRGQVIFSSILSDIWHEDKGHGLGLFVLNL